MARRPSKASLTARAQRETVRDGAPPKEGIPVEGGAKVETVAIEPIVPAAPEGEPTIDIITTGPGTFGPQGVVPVGTKATIPAGLYSPTWMRPADEAE